MKKMLFVFNPKSGKAQIKNKLLAILDIFTKAGYQIQVHVTQGPKEAIEIVRSRAEEVSLVVCSGGDGTLNETIDGIMNAERKPLLGYIPTGSTNDFATSLKISKNMLTAAADVVGGRPYAIDVGRFCEKHFVYIAAFGAFTDVSYMTSQDRKNVLGHQAYMLEAVKRLTQLKNYDMTLEWDNGNKLEGNFIFGMVTNTISVGGFKGLVNQNVALNDGEFEVLLIRTPKTPLDLSNIISYMFLKEEENEYVHKFRAKLLKIHSEQAVDWVLDGEFGGSRTDVEIENLQRAVRIMRNTPEKLIKT